MENRLRNKHLWIYVGGRPQFSESENLSSFFVKIVRLFLSKVFGTPVKLGKLLSLDTYLNSLALLFRWYGERRRPMLSSRRSKLVKPTLARSSSTKEPCETVTTAAAATAGPSLTKELWVVSFTDYVFNSMDFCPKAQLYKSRQIIKVSID